jgi:hypothetical protein
MSDMMESMKFIIDNLMNPQTMTDDRVIPKCRILFGNDKKTLECLLQCKNYGELTEKFSDNPHCQKVFKYVKDHKLDKPLRLEKDIFSMTRPLDGISVMYGPQSFFSLVTQEMENSFKSWNLTKRDEPVIAQEISKLRSYIEGMMDQLSMKT